MSAISHYFIGLSLCDFGTDLNTLIYYVVEAERKKKVTPIIRIGKIFE